MSGIAGMAMAAGAPASPDVLAQMMAAIAHRGPDGSADVVRGSAALGHRLLDVAGSGPAMSALVQSAGCIVAADCRLDNRDELIEALGVLPSIGDTELILAAYRRWDADAPSRLLGDFAFALWDEARGRLLCARDHFGVKPFYYHHGPQGFAFASEAEGVLASGWPDRAVNEDFVAAHLGGLAPRLHETVHRAVVRLPPAHVATLQAGRLEVRPYWRLQPIDVRGEDAAEGLRDRLRNAVEARMRGARSVGTMLSGGLDSSSVSCLASAARRRDAAGPLPTFSMVFDETPEHSERPHIEAVLEVIDAAPHFLPSNGVAHLAELPELLGHQNAPFLALNMATSRRLYTAARDAGVVVLLDGHGGDEVISSGAGHLSELAAKGRWRTIWRHLVELEASENWPARKTFWLLFTSFSPVAGLYQRLRKLRARLRPSPSPPPAHRRFLSPTYAARAAALEQETRPSAAPPKDAIEQANHLAILTGPLQAYALEITDKAAARAGIELRYPFWDKRVVEFCCSVAAEEKLKDGRTRALLRSAMAGALPESIRTRRDKFSFLPHFRAGMTTPPAPGAQDLFPDGSGLEAYLSLRELRAAYEGLLANPESCPPFDLQALWRCAGFAFWWRRNLEEDSAR